MIPQLATSYEWVVGTQKIRTGLLDSLTDADLSQRLGGSTLLLGELLRETGDIQHSYTQSFRTFQQDFSQRSAQPEHETSLEAIRSWYAALDAELEHALEAITEADLARTIDRGFPMSPAVQVDIYLQALLIQIAKVSVYLRSLDKPLSNQLIAWIG